ncbi:MAG TPA: PilZ domain-containing protein [Kofleriaceae bacterium]|nr:PilZ domain-containing protein [Kofleriaceae bacterium]
MSDDRRRWRRLGHELRLTLQIADGAGRTVHAIGTHLNPAGIYVQLADPPAKGTRVVVTVDADGAAGALTAEGVVVDRNVLDQESDHIPGVGIQLDRTSAGWSKLYQWMLDG